MHHNFLTDGLEALVESTKSKQTKKYKSQESSDSEEFEDLEDDDDDVNHGDDSTAKNGSKQITLCSSSIRQASEGTPSMKRSCPNAFIVLWRGR